MKPRDELGGIELFVINLEDIPILRDENPKAIFHLEVAATEVHYEDGSA